MKRAEAVRPSRAARPLQYTRRVRWLVTEPACAAVASRYTRTVYVPRFSRNDAVTARVVVTGTFATVAHEYVPARYTWTSARAPASYSAYSPYTQLMTQHTGGYWNKPLSEILVSGSSASNAWHSALRT